MIRGKGILVECIEDCEIEQIVSSTQTQNINFINGILYTAIIAEEICVIDREHQGITLTEEIFNKHFKIK